MQQLFRLYFFTEAYCQGMLSKLATLKIFENSFEAVRERVPYQKEFTSFQIYQYEVMKLFFMNTYEYVACFKQL